MNWMFFAGKPESAANALRPACPFGHRIHPMTGGKVLPARGRQCSKPAENFRTGRRGQPMHDVPTSEHWHEPQGLKNAGYGAWKRPNTPYDDYMEAQGIPIYRGIGVGRGPALPPH